ncbi:MAG: ATP-binding protein [Cyanobacteria bacterium P01_G01_bin.54]
MTTSNDAKRIRDLEKANRILQKKLQRSEHDRIILEENSDRRLALLRTVIAELENSKHVLEERTQALETALNNVQQMQSKLIESEKLSALGVLVAGIAHEINNPVSFVAGNIQPAQSYVQDLLGLLSLYQQNYPEPSAAIQDEIEAIDLEFLAEDLPKLLNSMQVGAGRISEIVRSLRTFTRADGEDFKAAYLQDGLESTLLILQHRLKANAEQSEVQIVQNYVDLPRIDCHPGKLNQVFMNLLGNAIDALRETETQHPSQGAEQPSHQITIQATVLGKDWLQIRIQDNGPGIPTTICNKLFDPFFTTKPVGQGTGLGLAISYQIIVEQHQGRLWCESEPGAGAAFVIELPIRQPKSAETEHAIAY